MDWVVLGVILAALGAILILGGGYHHESDFNRCVSHGQIIDHQIFSEQTAIVADGFRTYWLSDGHGNEDLLLLPLTAGCNIDPTHRVAHRTGSSLTVYPEKLDQIGPVLLANA